LLTLFAFITSNVIAFKKAVLSRGNRARHAAINFDAGSYLIPFFFVAARFCHLSRGAERQFRGNFCTKFYTILRVLVQSASSFTE